MKAAVLKAPGILELDEIPDPECPKGGALIEVKACAVCGTDIKMLQNGHKDLVYPRVLGHEIAGRVAEIDRDCGIAEGDLVQVWHAQNRGASFSLLQGASLLFLVVSILSVGMVVYFHRALRGRGWWLHLVLGVILTVLEANPRLARFVPSPTAIGLGMLIPGFAVFWVIVIIVPLRVFLIQPFFVQGASMEPNFEDKEYLIINELGYKRTEVGFSLGGEHRAPGESVWTGHPENNGRRRHCLGFDSRRRVGIDRPRSGLVA